MAVALLAAVPRCVVVIVVVVVVVAPPRTDCIVITIYEKRKTKNEPICKLQVVLPVHLGDTYKYAVDDNDASSAADGATIDSDFRA